MFGFLHFSVICHMGGMASQRKILFDSLPFNSVLTAFCFHRIFNYKMNIIILVKDPEKGLFLMLNTHWHQARDEDSFSLIKRYHRNTGSDMCICTSEESQGQAESFSIYGDEVGQAKWNSPLVFHCKFELFYVNVMWTVEEPCQSQPPGGNSVPFSWGVWSCCWKVMRGVLEWGENGPVHSTVEGELW